MKIHCLPYRIRCYIFESKHSDKIAFDRSYMISSALIPLIKPNYNAAAYYYGPFFFIIRKIQFYIVSLGFVT
ncbi:hypothetical protein PLUA15_460009 [Pseudomonas lundensis]|uniref:Uncharacterized protein n=1 Tax=Pseudomonas lundensis TaxID=86185 RepID=A0AAX2HAU7_9PSED|nr:hypothetical protein PLUA15_460009 [Pseudomonas lundensis]